MPEEASTPVRVDLHPVLNGGDLVVRAVQSDWTRSSKRRGRRGRRRVHGWDPRAAQKRFGKDIRLFRKLERSGQATTSDLAVAHAQGPFVEPLHHDDDLDRDCVASMASRCLSGLRSGIVFAPRRLEFSPGADEGERLSQPFVAPHKGFAHLRPLEARVRPYLRNSSRMVCATTASENPRASWCEDPASTPSVDSTCGRASGPTSISGCGCWPLDAAFIDRELSGLPPDGRLSTARNQASSDSWLDRLWIIESLMGFPAVRISYPELQQSGQNGHGVADRGSRSGPCREVRTAEAVDPIHGLPGAPPARWRGDTRAGEAAYLRGGGGGDFLRPRARFGGLRSANEPRPQRLPADAKPVPRPIAVPAE